MQNEVFVNLTNPFAAGVLAGMGLVFGCNVLSLASIILGEIADYALGRPRRLSLH